MANDPVLIAYAARRGRKGSVEYERIGRAYPHDRGSGLTLILDALPIKGWHLILLELDESDDRRLLAKARQRDRQHARARKIARAAPTRRQYRDPD